MDADKIDEFRRVMNDALASKMKRMLLVNDMHGNRILREVILDEFNTLNRFLNTELDRNAGQLDGGIAEAESQI